jgi:7-carboxy-7-deazaguanine synthase
VSKLKISEIFFSLQGEGPLTGYPTLFIRLFGCNLNCSWCDTPYAKGENPYEEKEIPEIISFWGKNFSSIPFITITGGEPLIQSPVYNLIDAFLNQGCIVALETNGSISLEKVPKEVIKVMDVKTPSSKMDKYNLYENFKFLTKKDAVKFVIKNRRDFNFAINIIEKFYLTYYTQIFLSPAYPFLEPKILADWILKSKKPLRFQIQLHKVVGIK